MALPISSSPLPPDVAATGWAAITVRVAWTLLALRVRPRREVLRDARDHVFFHLEPGIPLATAEDRAAYLTRQFVACARQTPFEDAWPQDQEMPLSPRWRKALDESLRPVTEAVFRHHYGYGRTVEELEQRLQVDRIALEEARGGLREIVRRVACADGLPLDGWSPERLDRLLVRLAAFSIHESPPLDEIADGCHQAWVRRCPRCDRTARLARAGILTSEDLLPPALGARPRDTVRVLAVHLHPEGKQHRAVLARDIGGHAQPVGDDILLVDADQHSRAFDSLHLAAEVGTPQRDHVRGVVLEGPGRWSRHGLLGPLAGRALQKLRAQPWGTVEGSGDLPEVVPPPPSSRSWWLGVAALGAVAAASVVWFLQPAPPAVDHQLSADFTEGRGGIWTRFDTAEEAQVTVVRKVGGRVDVLLSSDDAAEKAQWATGDGGYRLHTIADGVLLATSSVPVAELTALVDASSESESPLSDLAARIRAQQPGADVRFFER